MDIKNLGNLKQNNTKFLPRFKFGPILIMIDIIPQLKPNLWPYNVLKCVPNRAGVLVLFSRARVACTGVKYGRQSDYLLCFYFFRFVLFNFIKSHEL